MKLTYDIIKGARLIEQMEKTEAIKSLLLEKPNTSLSSMNDNEIIDDFKEGFNYLSSLLHLQDGK